MKLGILLRCMGRVAAACCCLPAAFGQTSPAILAAGQSVVLGPVPIDPADEHVYGIAYDIRGTRKLVVRPAAFRVLDGAGRQRQAGPIDPQGYGLFRVDVEDAWQTGRIEIFTKRGGSRLILTISAEGQGKAEIRNVHVVKGGFPDGPPLVGPPYLDWIRSLRADREIARRSPLLEFRPEDREGRGSRVVGISEATAGRLRKDLEPYLDLSPAALGALMPERRPVSFNGGDFDPGGAPEWNPREPDVLRSPQGTVVRFEQRYPVTGFDAVEAPNGKAARYPYHESGSKAGRRIYLDRFLTSARCNYLLRAAYHLALLYRKTGDREYAIRAGAILGAFARVLPGYPIFGRREWNDPVRRFFPPDTYEHWFAFTIAEWYTPFAARIIRPVRTYDLIRDAPVWPELDRITGRDTREDIENGFLFFARLTLKYDAYHRIEPWKFYHNTIAGEIRALAELGRALGCPELVHYAVRKMAGTLRYSFMADGIFPESTSYLDDILGGFDRALRSSMEDYSDPPGYRGILDGRHIARLEPEREIPFWERALAVMNRLAFPDNSIAPIHDTWAQSVRPRPRAGRTPAPPCLLPEFGHAVLTAGARKHPLEAHLHFSGAYGHAHADMLNLDLWAYGDELVSDVGYDYACSYGASTLSHNLVVVGGAWQRMSGIHRGELLAWHARPGAPQFVQASAPATVYPAAERYRRALILVPLGPARNAVVDIFEVRGGSRHDWMANGAADYAQSVRTDLQPARLLDNLAEDAKALAGAPEEEDPRGARRRPDKDRQPSVYYGAFRNLRESANLANWHVTMTAEHPQPDRNAGIRLSWVWPHDGVVMIGEAPRNRQLGADEGRAQERASWADLRMPKVIVRREGERLDSMFVAVWEPFLAAPWIGAIRGLEDIPAAHGAGVALAAGDDSATVLYRNPESPAVLRTPGFELDGRFGVLRRNRERESLEIYDGRHATVGRLTVRLAPVGQHPVVGQESGADGDVLMVRGNVAASGPFLRFLQEGQTSRWLPFSDAVSGTSGTTRLKLVRSPGFQFDPLRLFLREQFFPHRSLWGGAAVAVPTWASLRGRPGGMRLEVCANTGVMLEWRDVAIRGVRVRAKDGAWREVAVRRGPKTAAIDLPNPRSAWFEIEAQ